MTRTKNTYDNFANEYAEMIGFHQPPLYRDLVIPKMLDYTGDVSGLAVLDAGCGEGCVSRLLYDKGATIVGIDVAGKLIEIAKKRSNDRRIEFHCIDLSGDIPPRFSGMFDLVVSNMVVDDVPEYIGFIRNISI